MATQIVEQIFEELGLDMSKFAAKAEKAFKKNKELSKPLKRTEKAPQKAGKTHDELSKKQKAVNKQIAKMSQELNNVTKQLTSFLSDKVYAEIPGKLAKGDVTVAVERAKRMINNYSDNATGIIADALGEKREDIGGFIGESMYRLTHGGKSYEEVNNVKPLDEAKVSVSRPRQSGLAAAVALGAGVLKAENGSAKAENVPANKARAAAQYATVHAKSGSTGKCALFVNNALRAQGIKIWGHGKDVAGNLLKRGDFDQVVYDSNYVPQIGDIMSMPSSSKSKHNYGHVAIWNGYQWVSDFRQRARGNTAAPSDAYFADIKSGRIKPTIARMKSTGAASGSNIVKNASQTKKQAVTSINQIRVPVSGNNRTIAALIKTQGTQRVYEMADGSIETRDGGTVGWRNNNPGNLKFGYHGSADKTDKSRRSKEQALKDAQRRYKGVVALDQWGNAIFATVELGKQAKIKLLTGTHKNRTVSEMLRKYAVNDYSGKTHYGNYEKLIYQAGAKYGVNLKDKTIGQMSALELRALEEGMEKAEGIKEGKISISRKNLMTQQAEKAKKMVNTSQQQSLNNSKISNDNRKHVSVSIQNINVNTSEKTVSGNVVGAVKGVNNYLMNQIGASMT